MLQLQDILPILSILGFVITVITFNNSLKKAESERIDTERQRTAKETEHHVEQRTLLRGIGDDMRRVSTDVDKLNDKLDATGERLTRVEESTKQAHLRITKIEDKGC